MDFKHYKWFYTKSGKLVVGGKNAESNDTLLRELKSTKKDYVLMHTKSPGSPFCAVMDNVDEVTEEDKKECAIFTGCFSRAWKEKKMKTTVDSFLLSAVNKSKDMEEGTWGVRGIITQYNVELKLVMVIQEKAIRAVPEISVAKKKDILAYITPGNIDKVQAVEKLMIPSLKSIPATDVIMALPSGGVTFTAP